MCQYVNERPAIFPALFVRRVHLNGSLLSSFFSLEILLLVCIIQTKLLPLCLYRLRYSQRFSVCAALHGCRHAGLFLANLPKNACKCKAFGLMSFPYPLRVQRYGFIFKNPNISVFFLLYKMLKINALNAWCLPAIHTPSHVRINALPVPPVRFKSYPRTIPQLPKQNPWKRPVLPRGKKTLNPVNVAGKRFYFLSFRVCI